MSNEEDLYHVITEQLKAGGHLNKLQGEVRNKVLELLERNWNASFPLNVPKPPTQIVLLNQAIKEYLEWMGYTYTSSMFTAESGTNNNISNMSSVLKAKLNLENREDPQNVLPMLLNMFIAVMNSNES